MRLYFTILFFVYFIIPAVSQTIDTSIKQSPVASPIPIEALATDKAINFQMIVDKKFAAQRKFGFFSVVNLLNTYDNNKNKNEFMVLAMASHEVLKGISINAGMWANNAIGVRPTVALSYTRITKDYLLVYVPRVDLIEVSITVILGQPKRSIWGQA